MTPPPGPPTSRGVHLRRTEDRPGDADRVASLGERVGLGGLLDHLDRQATRVPVPGLAVRWGFAWEERDDLTRRWFPQGVTTSADATETEDVEGRRLLLTSWYSREREGSRITVVDLDTLRYRHVLLVQARDGLEPLHVHAGGLVWYADHLHVAGTRRGLFTCRTEDLVRLDDEVVRSGRSFGHRYVLPVRAGYAAASDEGAEPMRYSFLSVDRGSDPPALVAGEYASGQMTRRLVRFDLDPVTGHLATDGSGAAHPTWLDERGLGHMQGAAVVGDRWYVTASRGKYRLGQVCVGEPGRFRRFPRSTPVGPEDISYWPSEDVFWSLSEHVGHRYVFCMPRSAFAG